MILDELLASYTKDYYKASIHSPLEPASEKKGLIGVHPPSCLEVHIGL